MDKVSQKSQRGDSMNRHKYYILDTDGYILLTVISQPTNRNADNEAKLSISPLLPVIANQYGLEKVFYANEEVTA